MSATSGNESTHRPGARERGFTMVEVMIALLLTAVAVIGILALYISQTRASSFSRHQTEAASLANDKLETLRTTTVTAGTSSDTVDAMGNSGGIFTRTWTVTAATGYTDLSVSVSWDEDNGIRTLTVNGRRGPDVP